jgi:hypothetical protein
MRLELEEELLTLRRRLERINKTVEIVKRIDPDACYDPVLNDELGDVAREYADVADIEDVIRKLSSLSNQGRK